MKPTMPLMIMLGLCSLSAAAGQEMHDMDSYEAEMSNGTMQEGMEMRDTDKQSMDMDQMVDSMQGGSPPPDARDPDAYADGLVNGPMPGMRMADDEPYGMVLLEKFEYYNGNEGNGLLMDGQAWYGGDYNKLWLKADGERSGGEQQGTRFEVLWDHAITTYWGTQLGIRHDAFQGPQRDWLAFCVQGLAPYWFEIEATAYVGENGRTAARLETNYDLLLTQRLILQPNFEVNFYGKDDRDREIGSGLSDMDLSLRLRYEIRREIAPYIGIAYRRKFGDTADFARDEGEDVGEARLMIGLRLWY